MKWWLNMELYFCESWFCDGGFRWKGRSQNTKRRPGYFVFFLARVSLFMPLFEPICHDSNVFWRSIIVKTVGFNSTLQKVEKSCSVPTAQLYTEHMWADVEETILGQSVLLHRVNLPSAGIIAPYWTVDRQCACIYHVISDWIKNED